MNERWRYYERRDEVNRALQQALRWRETGPLCRHLRSNEPLEYSDREVLVDIAARGAKAARASAAHSQ